MGVVCSTLSRQLPTQSILHFTGHFLTYLRAFAARLGTYAAMFHAHLSMLFTFFGARVAGNSTNFTNRSAVHALKGHDPGRRPA